MVRPAHSSDRGGPGLSAARTSGRLLVLDLLAHAAGIDRDPAWLHRLRNLPHQIDLEQSALERGALYLHIISEVEHPPERTRRDTLIKILVLALFGLAAFHGERVLLGRDRHLVGAEAGQRQGDSIMILAGPLDVVRRVIVLAVPANGFVEEI